MLPSFVPRLQGDAGRQQSPDQRPRRPSSIDGPREGGEKEKAFRCRVSAITWLSQRRQGGDGGIPSIRHPRIRRAGGEPCARSCVCVYRSVAGATALAADAPSPAHADSLRGRPPAISPAQVRASSMAAPQLRATARLTGSIPAYSSCLSCMLAPAHGRRLRGSQALLSIPFLVDRQARDTPTLAFATSKLDMQFRPSARASRLFRTFRRR